MTRTSHRRRVGCTPLRALLATLLLSEIAGATTYNISSIADGIAVDGECRLREAIRAAETDLAVHECAAGELFDTIVLATVGTYVFDQGEENVDSGFLTIRGGTDSADAHRVDLGGANRFLATDGSVSLTLENLTLQNGFATTGGALYLPSGSNNLRNVTIRDSRALSLGGGVAMLTTGDGNVAFIENCRFLDNVVQSDSLDTHGGGLALSLGDQTELSIFGTTFERNSVVALGASASARGGGLSISCAGAACRLLLRRASFVDNTSAGRTAWGSAVAVVLSSSAAAVVEDISITGSIATPALPASRGSVLDFDLSSPGSQALALRRFELLASGGSASTDAQLGLRVAGSSSVLCESGLIAGGVHSGILLGTTVDGQVLLGQLTVAGNDGAGLLVFDASTVPPRIENSILWDNTFGGSVADLVLVTGAIDADRTANHNWIGDRGDPDPQFHDAPAGDYSLDGDSGAVDAGDSAFPSVGPFDLRHATRVVGPQTDLGALERDGLFADDFESAGHTAWSSTIP